MEGSLWMMSGILLFVGILVLLDWWGRRRERQEKKHTV